MHTTVRNRIARASRANGVVPLVVCLAAVTLPLAGCATAVPTTTAHSETAACRQAAPKLAAETGAVSVSAGCHPVNTAVAVDVTAFGRGPAVAERVSRALVGAAQVTLAQGGRLRITVFGRLADRSLTLIDTTLASPEGEGEVARAGANRRFEQALGKQVAEIFDPAHAPGTPQLTAQLKALELGPPESDVARAAREATANAAAQPGSSLAVVLSDGLVNTPELNLAALLPGSTSVRQLSARLEQSIGSGRRADLFALEGAGEVPPAYLAAQTGKGQERLLDVWREACPYLARTCQIESTLP